MSKLDDLIKELCPGGVEYKKLGEFAKRVKGTPITATQMKQIASEDGEIRIFAGGKTVVNAKEKDIPKANITRVPAILVQSRGMIDFIYYDKPFTFKNEMWAYTFENKTTVKFVYYVLKNNVKYFRSLTEAMGAFPQIALPDTEKFQIPIPPLPVQEEIVRILDTFTSLTAELTAELTARRRQYEYYRDELLTPPFASTTLSNQNNHRSVSVVEPSKLVCEYKKLGDFATITRGGNFQKKDFVENGLPCIHYGQMYTHFGTWTDKTLTFVDKDVFDKSKQAQPNDIVMAVTSENVDDVCKCTAWVGKEPIAVSGHTAIIHHNQNAKYLSYYFQSSVFYKQKVKLAHGTKVIEVTPDKLRDITIPLPPLDVQQRIVNVLDNFDSICTDLKIGLPAEIEARKKQYEYYRDKLLTFASSGNTILTEQNRTEQNRTEQNRTEQNRTEQNRTEQNRTDEIKLLQYVFGYAVVQLGEIATYADTRIKAKDIVPTNYVSVENLLQNKQGVAFTDKMPTGDSFICYQKNDILIGNIRPYLKKIWKSDKTGGTNGDVLTVRIKNEMSKNISASYLYYQLSSDNFFNYDMQNAKGAKMPRGSKEAVMKYEFILPSFEEQERIVKILDRFDSLCNDISSGLPAEIEARQKQYEYYRDKLLTF